MVEIAVLREPLTGILPYYDPVDDAHQFLVTRAVEVDCPAPFIRQPEHGLFALSRIGVRRQPRRDTLLLFAYPAERPEELRCLGHFISVQRGILDAEPVGLPLVVAAVAEQQQLRGGAAKIHNHLGRLAAQDFLPDRKSTRLNSSHVAISYAVFCLKKKTNT